MLRGVTRKAPHGPALLRECAGPFHVLERVTRPLLADSYLVHPRPVGVPLTFPVVPVPVEGAAEQTARLEADRAWRNRVSARYIYAILRGAVRPPYAKTVPSKTIASRRAANRVARASRRVNRGRA
jgi:hypothetical protein